MKATPNMFSIKIIAGIGMGYWNTQYDVGDEDVWGITHFLLIGPFLISGTKLWFDIEATAS